MKLRKQIISTVEQGGYESFTITDIIELGNYDNLRKTLERMADNGEIRRLIRGVYDIPHVNKTFNIECPPSIDGIAKAIARANNWDVCPSGDYALNILGLSTQIPSKYIFASSGPYRSYEFQGMKIEFKHAPLKEMKSFSYNTIFVVQALKSLGKDNITEDVVFKTANNFSNKEIDQIIKEGKTVTVWVYKELLKMKGKGKP